MKSTHKNILILIPAAFSIMYVFYFMQFPDNTKQVEQKQTVTNPAQLDNIQDHKVYHLNQDQMPVKDKGMDSQQMTDLKQQEDVTKTQQNKTIRVKTIKQLRGIGEKDFPYKMQIGIRQVRVIAQAIISTSKSKNDSALPTSNILVWGCGNDSPFWHTLTAGKVVFIEDLPSWINKTATSYPFLTILQVNYTTIKTDETFQRYTTSKDYWSELDIRYQLPDWVLATKWDIFIVDSPCGFGTKCPGRYQPIYTTFLMRQNPCHIFVDDCERKVEDVFGKLVYGKDHFMGQQNRAYLPNRQCYYVFKDST